MDTRVVNIQIQDFFCWAGDSQNGESFSVCELRRSFRVFWSLSEESGLHRSFSSPYVNALILEQFTHHQTEASQDRVQSRKISKLILSVFDVSVEECCIQVRAFVVGKFESVDEA